MLVLGGSGAVGRFLLRRLHAAGDGAVALSRRPPPRWAQSWRTIRWQRGGLPTTRLADFASAECLLSAGPLDALAEACERSLPASLRHVVALSSLSTVWKLQSSNAAERELAARLLDAEQRLRLVLLHANIELVLLRPSMIYGAGIDGHLSLLLRMARRWRVLPWPRFATGQRAPVHADDLAAAMLACASSKIVSDTPLALAGVDALPYDRMIDRLLSSCAPHARRLPLPLPRTWIGKVAKGGSRWAGRASNIQRMALDQLADSTAWARIGIQPRAFAPSDSDFEPWMD